MTIQKRISIFFVSLFFALFSASSLFVGTLSAQEMSLLPSPEQREFQTGTVQEVLDEKRIEVDGTTFYTQKLRVKNDETGEISDVDVGSEFQPLSAAQRISVGSKVVLSAQTEFDGSQYTVITDVYRIPVLIFLTILFFLLVAVVGGIRGVFSIIGMFSTFIVLGVYMLPAILKGTNPVLVSIVSSFVIAFFTIYLAHGFNKKSHVSFVSILSVLGVVVFLSSFVVKASRLLGLGDEQSYFLQFGNFGSINLQGLFLAGIIIGALGVLDDIVVAQVSVVEQLLSVEKKMSKQELYFRALEVGKDHVASLVNTLVLAYAGTSLPLFLLFFVNEDIPAWVKINDQTIAEEIVRTITGSIGLVLAVPLTTLLAVAILRYKDVEQKKGWFHHHH